MVKKFIEKKTFLSIVIPCFNEDKNIPLILKRFEKLKSSKDLENFFEIIIVNNGSTDKTKEILSKEIKKYNFAKSITIKKNKGYGFGILEGLKETNSEFIGWTHGDLQTDPSDILKASMIIKKFNFSEKLFIKGKRKGRSIFDQLFSDSMSIFESLLFTYPLYEINAQPTVFHRSLYENCFEPPYDFSLDLYFYILAKKLNLKIKRFDVRFINRIHGYSKWNKNFYSKLKFIFRTLRYSLKLRLQKIK